MLYRPSTTIGGGIEKSSPKHSMNRTISWFGRKLSISYSDYSLIGNKKAVQMRSLWKAL